MPLAVPPLVITVCFPNRSAASAAATRGKDHLSLLVPTGQRVTDGTGVKLYVSFADSSRTFMLLGKTTGSTEQTEGRLRVEFSGTERRGAAGMLVYCAGRPLTWDTRGVTKRAPLDAREGEPSRSTLTRAR